MTRFDKFFLRSVAAVLFLASCSLGPDAQLTVSKAQYGTGSMCPASVTITNLRSVAIYANVDMVLLDSGGNTLDESTIMFDYIMPGKSQTKEVYFHSDCWRIATGKVIRANDRALTGYLLSGVQGAEFVFK